MLKLLTSVWGWLRTAQLLWTSLVMMAAWQVYQVLAPSRPEYSRQQLGMIADFGRQAGAWVGGLNLARDKAFLGNLGRDPFGAVTGPLRQELWQSDCFDLLDRELAEKIRATARWTLPTYGGASKLVQRAAACRARYAVGGEVIQLKDTSAEALLRVRLGVWESPSGRLVAEKVFELAPGSLARLAPSTPSRQRPGLPLTYKVFFWAVCTGLLPLLVLPARRPVLVEGGNGLILAVLLALTAVSGVAAYFCFAIEIDSFWGGLIMLVAVALSAWHHFRTLAWFREKFA